MRTGDLVVQLTRAFDNRHDGRGRARAEDEDKYLSTHTRALSVGLGAFIGAVPH